MSIIDLGTIKSNHYTHSREVFSMEMDKMIKWCEQYSYRDSKNYYTGVKVVLKSSISGVPTTSTISGLKDYDTEETITLPATHFLLDAKDGDEVIVKDAESFFGEDVVYTRYKLRDGVWYLNKLPSISLVA